MSGPRRSEERLAPLSPRSATPRFSVRFEKRRASLSLSEPLAFAGGRLEALDIDLGSSSRAVDLSRGWRALRHRRGVATALRLALDLETLVSRVPGLTLVGPSEKGFLVTLARAHAHVAFELVPLMRGADVLLMVGAARSALDGPRSPTAEALSIGAELGARFDAERGALLVPDPLLDALTDALVPHGLRVPALVEHRRAPPEIRGGQLVLALAAIDPGGAAATPLPSPLDAELALAPALVALVEGAIDRAQELLRAARTPSAEALRAELALELGEGGAHGGVDACGAALELRAALRRGRLGEVASAARTLDGLERAAPVAVDGLLAAAALARSIDPAVEAELLGRALARSPDDPRVLATSAPLPSVSESAPLLRTLERSAALRSRDLGVEWGAIGRLRGHLGDPRGAIEACERAVRAAPGDAALAEGLADALERGGHLDAASRAWTNAAERRLAAGEPVAEARAHLAAARLEHAGGRPREALVLCHRARSGAVGALLADVEDVVAGLALAVGDAAALAAAERALVVLADAGDFGARAAVGGALARALTRRPSRALLEALARLWPDHPVLADRRDALDRQAFAEIEATPAAERAEVARRLSERLRGEGRIADAAIALVRAGELLGDAATLRAAVDLAERAGDLRALEHVVDRALAVVGDGPARAALERRRPARPPG